MANARVMPSLLTPTPKAASTFMRASARARQADANVTGGVGDRHRDDFDFQAGAAAGRATEGALRYNSSLPNTDATLDRNQVPRRQAGWQPIMKSGLRPLQSRDEPHGNEERS